MLSKSGIKYINKLYQKKYRYQEKQFIVEGDKMVNELVASSFEVLQVYALQKWIDNNAKAIKNIPVEIVSKNDLEKISALSNPGAALAIVKIPENEDNISAPNTQLILALDNIKDPGNMGTIIRVADWFGIQIIVCSPECVDIYNPKVIQSTMGSIFRVSICSKPLEDLLIKADSEAVPVYGAVMDGKNIYHEKLANNGIILLGNESTGISPEINKFISNKITIPSFPIVSKTDSLNVSVAAGIICSEFRRRNHSIQSGS